MIIRLDSESAVALRKLRAAVDADGALGSPAERERALEHIEQLLQPPFDSIGAFISERLVGAATISRMPESPFDPDASNWYSLSAVIVHPCSRGQGIGKALVQECLSQAAQLNAAGILLELNVPNPAAKALYESFGFEPWNVRQAAYRHNGQRFDQVSMRKNLSKS